MIDDKKRLKGHSGRKIFLFFENLTDLKTYFTKLELSKTFRARDTTD